MPLTISQPSNGVTSSLDAGSVTAGVANTLICDSGPLAAGNGEPCTFIIESSTFQTGTVDANGANMLVNIGGTNTAGVISAGTTIGKLQSGSVLSLSRFRVTVNPGQHVYIVVGNTNAGAGAVYNAAMSVTRAINRYADV